MTYFHGTPFYFQNGETLLPGSETGQGDRHEFVYVTNDLQLALQYGIGGHVFEVEVSEKDIVDNDVFGYGEGTIMEVKRAVVIRESY